MSEPEKFRRVDDLYVPDEFCATVASDMYVQLNPYIGKIVPRLTVRQARMLRDWLDRALPEETVTVVWTVPADEESAP